MSTRPTNDETDGDRIVRLGKTNREAFAVLYDRYFPLVYRYCQRRLLDCAAAENVSSDVFLCVAQSIHRFAGTTEVDFRRWLYCIATNSINAHFRKRQRRQALFARAAAGGWWSVGEAAATEAPDERIAALAPALARLSQREQTVITLRFWENLSYEEVGRILNARPATVRVIASRAIRTLRDHLAGWQQLDIASREDRSP